MFVLCIFTYSLMILIPFRFLYIKYKLVVVKFIVPHIFVLPHTTYSLLVICAPCCINHLIFSGFNISNLSTRSELHTVFVFTTHLKAQVIVLLMANIIAYHLDCNNSRFPEVSTEKLRKLYEYVVII